MSVMQITFDTVTKDVKASIDGADISNLYHVGIEVFEDQKGTLFLETHDRSHMDKDGFFTTTTIHASEDGKVKYDKEKVSSVYADEMRQLLNRCS